MPDTQARQAVRTVTAVAGVVRDHYVRCLVCIAYRVPWDGTTDPALLLNNHLAHVHGDTAVWEYDARHRLVYEWLPGDS